MTMRPDLYADPPTVQLRPGVAADIDAIARIWHEGWRDAHIGRVPDALLEHRRPEDLRQRIPVRLGTTTVATTPVSDGPRVAGFVTVHDDEIEQIYVDAVERGSGVAQRLLAHGEAVIAAHHDRAWLAVVAGNARARRFYERNGWVDAGPFDNPAWTTTGGVIPVPTRRYEKQLGHSRRASSVPGRVMPKRSRSTVPSSVGSSGISVR